MDKNILNTNWFPISAYYPYDEKLSMLSEFIVWKDGYTTFKQPIFKSFRDSSFNKNSNLILSNALSFFDIFKETTNDTIMFGGYTTLSMDDSYVTVRSDGKLLLGERYTDFFNENVFCLVYHDEDGTLSIMNDNKLVTVTDSYPFELFMDYEYKRNNIDRQRFKFKIIEGSGFDENYYLYLTTCFNNNRSAIGGPSIIQQFISYEKYTKLLRANGMVPDDDYAYSNAYLFKIIDFSIYFKSTGITKDQAWVNYYNSVMDKRYNKNTEISYDILGLKVNRFIDIPYNSKISVDYNNKIATMQANIANLKNILTPSYRNGIKIGVNLLEGIGYWYLTNPAKPILLDFRVS